MPRGGSKPGERRGGRKAGVPNRASAAREAAIAASGLTPLQFLVETFRDEDQPFSVRLDAAKAAANFVHPRLAAVGVGNQDQEPIKIEILRFSDIDTPAC